MSKKGQITIFIIIGILLVFLIVTLVLFIGLREEEQIEVPEELSAVKLYIDSCIEDVGKNAIVDNSAQGGYYQLPKLSTQGYYIDTPYYFYRLEAIVPSLIMLENQLSFHIEENLKNCLNFSQFKEQGIDVNIDDISSAAMILENSVVFNINLPIIVKVAEATIGIQTFSVTIENVNLKKIHGAAVAIIQEQANDPYSLCLSCIADIAEQTDLLIDTANLNDNALLFTITDLNSLIDEEPLIFQFSNKYIEYDCSNLPSTLPDSVLQSKLIECAQQR